MYDIFHLYSFLLFFKTKNNNTQLDYIFYYFFNIIRVLFFI